MNLTPDYWNNRYQQADTGWDIGIISTPLKTYFDQLQQKDIKILIPGAGNAHEAEYLIQQGFSHVYVLDYSAEAITRIKKNIPLLPAQQIFQENFFNHTGTYDLIIEQTFFCALHPTQRNDYAVKMFSLLKPGGKLVGLLFNCEFNLPHPPYGGNREEYLSYFEPLFDIKQFQTAYNSILPRKDRELFIILKK